MRLFGIGIVEKNSTLGQTLKQKKCKTLKRIIKFHCCVDVGINAPNIYGVLVQGNANLIIENSKVKTIAKKILARYFKTLKNKSAIELLDDTDCIIEIVPEKFMVWNY